jgi:hypothetical protein
MEILKIDDISSWQIRHVRRDTRFYVSTGMAAQTLRKERVGLWVISRSIRRCRWLESIRGAQQLVTASSRNYSGTKQHVTASEAKQSTPLGGELP